LLFLLLTTTLFSAECRAQQAYARIPNEAGLTRA
jgi:hypothetical protein